MAPVPSGTGVSKYMSEATFNSMFPYVAPTATQGCTGKGFYTYKAFLTAAARFPDFGTASADAATNKREIAAFLAQASQETSGAAAGTYNGGLCWKEEGAATPLSGTAAARESSSGTCVCALLSRFCASLCALNCVTWLPLLSAVHTCTGTHLSTTILHVCKRDACNTTVES